MKVTKSQLLRLCFTYPKDRVDDDVRFFNEWQVKFGITTPLRIAHFFAQLAHESGGFQHVEENLNYSADALLKTFPKYFTPQQAKEYANNPVKIASRVYGNRMGNGSEDTKEGYVYRGRGYIQVTGKTNYKLYQNSGYCKGNILNYPDLLTKAPGRLKSAMWFWYSRGCNKLADEDDVTAITKKINGGINGLSNRKYYLRKAKSIFVE